MHGPDILARSLSVPAIPKAGGGLWQYHSQSDRHSKIGCWGIIFDLLISCPLLRKHVSEQKVFFGLNHTMRDFQQNRKKKLDLVLCTQGGGRTKSRKTVDFFEAVARYGVVLTPSEKNIASGLPRLREAPVGAVLLALEAKACMTAHQKAIPRFYDELNSSHATVHGATDEAIAAGFVMVNGAASFVSPKKPGLPPNSHRQPWAAEIIVNKVDELPRRAGVGRAGFDAIGVVVIDFPNDGSRVSIIRTTPAPAPGDSFHYDSMIHRISNLYSTRFVLL